MKRVILANLAMVATGLFVQAMPVSDLNCYASNDSAVIAGPAAYSNDSDNLISNKLAVSVSGVRGDLKVVASWLEGKQIDLKLERQNKNGTTTVVLVETVQGKGTLKVQTRDTDARVTKTLSSIPITCEIEN